MTINKSQGQTIPNVGIYLPEPVFSHGQLYVALSRGFWSWLTGVRSNALPPPDFTLPGVTIPPPLPDHVEPGKTRITTLPNGVRIASDTSAGPSCSVGVYVNCGSVYEAPKTLGATQLLKKLAFGTTTNRSQLRVVREIEAIGGNVKASANREMMSYSYAALKTYMPEMVEVLIDCVRNPSFLHWEVNEQIMKLKAELAEASSNPETLLLEALHSTGYSDALANSLIASESSVSRLNTDVLEDFLAVRFILSFPIDSLRFVVITISLLTVIYLATIFIPSIWDAFQFTGATAAVLIGFMISSFLPWSLVT